MTDTLQIPKSGYESLPIEARLGDLDLKAASGKKADYWQSVERQLIDEDWYAARVKTASTSERFCHLL